MSNTVSFRTKIWKDIYLAAWIIFGICHAAQSIVLTMGSAIPGDLGDSRLNNLQLEHGYQSLTSKASFISPSQYFPTSGTISHSDMHIGTLPFYAIPRVIGATEESSFQLWAITIVAINLWGAAYLLRTLRMPNLLIGPIAFSMASPSIAVHFLGAHIQLIPVFPLLLAIASTIRFERTKAIGDLIAIIAFLSWLHLCSPYLGFFGTIAIAPFLLIVCGYRSLPFAILKDKRLTAKHALNTIPVLLCIAMYLLYFAETEEGTRPWVEAQAQSPRLRDWFQSPNGNWLYQSVLPIYNEENPSEFALFSGTLPWIGMFAALFLFFSMKQDHPSRKIGFASAITALALLVLFTRFGDSGLFLWLAKHFEALRTFRAPGRAIVAIHIFQTIALSSVVIYLIHKLKIPSSIHPIFLVAAIIAAETITYSQASTEKSIFVKRREAVITSWREAGNKSILALVPGHTNQHNSHIHLDAWAAALATGRKTINGYSGRIPAGFSSFLNQPTGEKLNELIHRKKIEIQEISIVTGWGAAETELGIERYRNLPIGQLEGFQIQPDNWQLAFAPKRYIIETKDYYLLHPPATLDFQAPNDSNTIEFDFGLHEGTYKNGGNTDGVIIKWILLDEQKERTIYSRHWDPLNNIEDQGFHRILVPLPYAESRRIRLQIEKGPENRSFDWALFSNVSFTVN